MSTKTWGIVLGVVALLILGFFLKGPLPVIQLPAERLAGPFPLGFSLTNTILATWLTMGVLLGLTYGATRFRHSRMRLVPQGVQNLVETIVELLLDFCTTVAGPQYARKFLPLVATIFLFIILSAWLALFPGFGTIGLVKAEEHGHAFPTVDLGVTRLGFILPGAAEGGAAEDHEKPQGEMFGELVPFLRSANTDLNTPLAMALVAMLFVELWGIQAHGPLRYGSKFLNIGGLLRGRVFSGFVDLFISIIEAFTEVLRIVSLTFRLFGNMFAGEVLVGVITFLVPLVAVLVFYALEIFVGFVQALVFAGLTLVFAAVAVAGHSEEGPEGHHGS